MKLAIYPPIGLSRLGNSPDGWFLTPEVMGSGPFEVGDDGSERVVNTYKDDDYRMKRQGARFRLMQVSDSGEVLPFVLPAGAVVSWSVAVANKKDAVDRPSSPPFAPYAVVLDPSRSDRHIQGSAKLVGPNVKNTGLVGSYRDLPVLLADCFTDSEQRLVVLGGRGRAESPSGAGIGQSFYNNPDWFDDTADGVIRATVTLADATELVADSAWWLSAPPDFAPVSGGVVTLWDVIRQMAIDEGWVKAPSSPSFDLDIHPILARAASLRHVDRAPSWAGISTAWAVLRDPSPTTQNERERVRDLVLEAEIVLHDFELRQWQLEALDQWAKGDFDPTPTVASDADQLVRAGLDTTVGQGFFPGIEAGINITDPKIYRTSPFAYRIDDGALGPGDLTALMALPWQADFLKCSGHWWPAQRPDVAPQASGPSRPWLRPSMDHATLVEEVMKLGVVAETEEGKVVEEGRHPDLGA